MKRYAQPLMSLLICGVLASASATEAPAIQAPDSPQQIRPILIGQSLPAITLKRADGGRFDLNAAVRDKPAALIFYRGGWCPYCNMHLAKLQTIESQLTGLGIQILAISADRPEILDPAAKKNKVTYQLLSDNDMTAAAALGIAFRVDNATVAKYKNEYQIDIEADSGRRHHLLPVPAAFLIDRAGIVQFSYVNPDYKTRVNADLLLKAAEEMVKHSAQDQ